MENIAELVGELTVKDNNVGCAAMKTLVELSGANRDVYVFFDEYVKMLGSKNSYERNRAIAIISANAKWDTENRIDDIIDELLTHVTDEKPITARQCIKALTQIAKYKTELKGKICSALKNADVSSYKDSMAPLVLRDIAVALDEIERYWNFVPNPTSL